ncbi:MAG: hypothetical protein LBQ31_11435 [Bacteroidales bacterium]|nr:hypothetical protein [Bacteroidales bacterium]
MIPPLKLLKGIPYNLNSSACGITNPIKGTRIRPPSFVSDISVTDISVTPTDDKLFFFVM